VKSTAEKGPKKTCAGKRKGAPAGAGVIVDIQRGKYTISGPHKFSQSDEPPCAVRGGLFPPRAWRQRYLYASSRAQIGRHYVRTTHTHALMHALPRKTNGQNCLSKNAELVPAIPEF